MKNKSTTKKNQTKTKKESKGKEIFSLINTKELSTLSTLFASGCHYGMISAKR